jgi:Ala-tRNA(Pro) deacylase
MNIRLRNFLESRKVRYVHETHRTAYTAQELAQEEHVPGKMVAKTVVVKLDDAFALAVMPATARADFARLKSALGAREVRLATELEFTGLFPDCEVGAMPPFGNLYGVPVYVDAALAQDEEVIFNAGTHQDTIRMRYADFERLALPKVFSFALARAAA